jgi:hypothetical protein
VVKPPSTSSSEAGETRVRNMAAEFCLRASFHARRVLLHVVIYEMGPSSSAGFEPANLGSSGKHANH